MQKKRTWWERLLLCDFLVRKNASHRIAYIAVVTAFCVAGNTFFSFPLGDFQVSLTVLLSALSGILLGPIFGFTAGFLGDLIGFLYNNAGFVYMPTVGLATGLTAFLSGFFVSFIKGNGKSWFLYIRLALVCISTFFLCTVAINTTTLWIVYSSLDYFTYLAVRLFAQGQIWVSLVNYGLLFVLVPSLNQILSLKLDA